MVKIVLVILFFFLPISTSVNNIQPKTKKNVKKEEEYYIVSVTMYTIDPKQTDSLPLETASGFMLDSINPKKHRIIAVSHDLKRKMKWGQKVRVTGVGKWSGDYYVRDLMNKKWYRKIDILINPQDTPKNFKSAKLYIL